MDSFASPTGTDRFAARFAGKLAEGHFRRWPPGAEAGQGLTLSSLGMGTYTGPVDAPTDDAYRLAVMSAVRRGVNVIDCAINYRHMRSERAIGAGLGALFESGEASRDEILLMTKGGYLPFDGDRPADTAAYLRETYVETGLLDEREIASGCHAIAPSFLENQIGRSLENLGLEAVDVYFLHNVEQQLEAVDRTIFCHRVEAAFAYLESAAAAGKIGLYGVATWKGFRSGASERGHLELEELLRIAEKVGGEEHRFRVVQLPYNLGMLEALTEPTQTLRGKPAPFLSVAQACGMLVVTSVPLLQTQVLGHVPASFASRMPGLETAAQRALQFARSTPGVLAPLVGMKTAEHVEENTGVCRQRPLSAGEFRALLAG